AVFAIAIMLLVLEIRLPHLNPEAGGRELIRALLLLTPKLIGFAVSFAVVGSMWIEHHRIFRYIGAGTTGCSGGIYSCYWWWHSCRSPLPCTARITSWGLHSCCMQAVSVWQA